MNNLGDAIIAKDQIKVKTKIQEKEEEYAKIVQGVKSIKQTDTLDAAKLKLKSVIETLYKGHHLVNNMSYLAKKRNTLEVINQGYNILHMKGSQLESLKETL